MIPLWFKIVYTLFAAFIAFFYARHYRLVNFLWFSDIALFGTVAAVWLEDALLVSTLAVGVLLPELLWNVGYFTRLMTGVRLGALTDYMFDESRSRFLRGLSLFHVVLPVVLVWLLVQLGYQPEALLLMTILAWIVMPASYWLSKPEENVNLVYGLFGRPQTRFHPVVHVILLMLGLPILVYLPTHLLLAALFA